MTIEFQVRHELPCSAADFWRRVHLSEAFNRALYLDHLGFRYEPLEADEARGVYRARVWPDPDAPAFVVKLLGDAFSFIDEGTMDRDAMLYRFQIVPSTLPDKIRTTGVVRAESLGDDRCARVVDFRIDARILGVGKLLERYLKSTTVESFDQSAAFAREWLARDEA